MILHQSVALSHVRLPLENSIVYRIKWTKKINSILVLLWKSFDLADTLKGSQIPPGVPISFFEHYCSIGVSPQILLITYNINKSLSNYYPLYRYVKHIVKNTHNTNFEVKIKNIDKSTLSIFLHLVRNPLL